MSFVWIFNVKYTEIFYGMRWINIVDGVLMFNEWILNFSYTSFKLIEFCVLYLDVCSVSTEFNEMRAKKMDFDEETFERERFSQYFLNKIYTKDFT